MDLFAWDTWSIPLMATLMAAVVVLPFALARPLWDAHQHRRRRQAWEKASRAQSRPPLERALDQMAGWDGYLPDWVVEGQDR